MFTIRLKSSVVTCSTAAVWSCFSKVNIKDLFYMVTLFSKLFKLFYREISDGLLQLCVSIKNVGVEELDCTQTHPEQMVQTGSTCVVKSETREWRHISVRGVGMMDEFRRRTQTSLCPRQTVSVSTWLITHCHGNRHKI